MLASLPLVGGLLGKIGVKGIAIGLAFTGVLAIVSFGYWHYTSLLDKVETLRSNNQTLEQGFEQQQKTISSQSDAIDEWEQSQEELRQRLERLQEVARAARKETRRLNDLFAEHDLGRLAREKPGLIERRVNDGTSDALRMLECASGADHADCRDGSQAPAPDSNNPEAAAD